MTQKGFWPWDIQTGPFAAFEAYFVPKLFYLFHPAPHNKPFLIAPRERRKEGARAENGKREFFKSEWHQGVSDLGAFKLDHLQPAELILF